MNRQQKFEEVEYEIRLLTHNLDQLRDDKHSIHSLHCFQDSIRRQGFRIANIIKSKDFVIENINKKD
jgi:hypothetical protein